MNLRQFFIITAMAGTIAGCHNSTSKNVGQYVDPNIGGVAPLLTTVTPQVHRPHSMVRIYPITEPGLTDKFVSDRIYGIALNMPRYRLGEVSSVMPTSGEVKTDSRSTSSWYDHDMEQIHPWMHKVFLDDFDITASWTTTERTSSWIFDFNNTERQSNVIFRILGNGNVKIEDNRTVSGWETIEYAKQYFYAQFDTPFNESGVFEADSMLSGKQATGTKVGAWFSTKGLKQARLKIGISYIDIEQARKNLEDENRDRKFEDIVAESQQIWEDNLSKIRVEGGTEREKRIFYTSLYRTFERMVDQSEGNRYYSGFDRQVHTDSVHFFNDDWIWDTYRNLHALQMILDPTQKAKHMQSYVRMYQQWGWVPNFPELTEWNGDWVGSWSEYWRGEPMIGNHTASLLAEAIKKGVTDFDIEAAYEGIRKNALDGTMVPWRSGPAKELDKFYSDKGYFPALAPGEKEPHDYVDDGWEKRQAVSVTLEHSYDDWCLAQVAKYLGKEDDYELLMKRSQNYLNLWNPQIGYFAPKNEKGKWITPFDPQLCDGFGARSYFAEVNACVHLFHVQHDIPKLVELLGGEQKFVDKIDATFNEAPEIGKWRFMGRMPDATGLQGMIPVGNEPAFHIPYLYNYAGAAWKTQYRVRQLMDLWFDDRPTGLSGDEDGGALTAWYVFSAMGFYPVNPASGEYALSSPIFSLVEISLPHGGKFTIKAPGASKTKKYITSAKLNGKPLDRPFITHQDIINGGTLEYTLSEKPDKNWGK